MAKTCSIGLRSAHGAGAVGYAFNVLIDTPGGVAMDVEASPARFAAEADAGRAMLGVPVIGSPTAFRYERERNRYVCPAGKTLDYRGVNCRPAVLKSSVSPTDCRAWHLKRKCTTGSNLGRHAQRA